MTPGALVLELHAQGLALEADGDQLRCRGPRDALGPDIVSLIKKNKATLLDLLRGHMEPRPSMLSLFNSWQAQTGGSPRKYLDEFLRITGCDFDERNPEWIELYLFEAHLARKAQTAKEGALHAD